MDAPDKIEVLTKIFAVFGILPIKQYDGYNTLIQIT